MSVDTVIVARQVQRSLASHSLCRWFLSLGPVHFLLSQFSALRNLWGHVPPVPTSEAKLGWVLKEIAASSKHKLPKEVSFQHILTHDDLRFVLLMMKRYWTKPWEICHYNTIKAVRGWRLSYIFVLSPTCAVGPRLSPPPHSCSYRNRSVFCLQVLGSQVPFPPQEGWVMLYLEPGAMWAPSPTVIRNEGKMRRRCLKVLIKVKKWSLSISGAFFESSKHGDRLCCICHIFTFMSNTY